MWAWFKRHSLPITVVSTFVSTANAVLVFGWFDYVWRVLAILAGLFIVAALVVFPAEESWRE